MDLGSSRVASSAGTHLVESTRLCVQVEELPAAPCSVLPWNTTQSPGTAAQASSCTVASVQSV